MDDSWSSVETVAHVARDLGVAPDRIFQHSLYGFSARLDQGQLALARSLDTVEGVYPDRQFSLADYSIVDAKRSRSFIRSGPEMGDPSDHKTMSGTSIAAAHVSWMMLRGGPIPDGFVIDPRGDVYVIPVAPPAEEPLLASNSR